MKISECTVHIVDPRPDAGPIGLQAAVPVLENETPDSLSARILAEEHRIYSEAIAIVLAGHFRIEGRRGWIKGLARIVDSCTPAEPSSS